MVNKANKSGGAIPAASAARNTSKGSAGISNTSTSKSSAGLLNKAKTVVAKSGVFTGMSEAWGSNEIGSTYSYLNEEYIRTHKLDPTGSMSKLNQTVNLIIKENPQINASEVQQWAYQLIAAANSRIVAGLAPDGTTSDGQSLMKVINDDATIIGLVEDFGTVVRSIAGNDVRILELLRYIVTIDADDFARIVAMYERTRRL